jgi:catechol 2,3-dioxygenase-like lactoylglutathione lyase family enzyme
MLKLHFDAIYYRVSDLDHAISFYRDVLGLRLLTRDVVARLDLDGVLVELVPDSSAPHPRASGNARLCFRVQDVHTARAELQKKDIPVGPVEEKNNGLLVTFSDPDGNELSLWQYR